MLKTVLLLFHIVALLLAATSLTLITFPLGLSDFHISFYAYCYADGWGYVYHSDFTLPTILTYIAAYSSGVILYPLLTLPRPLGIFAAVVCGAGLISFLMEISHWFFDHHLSLIASFPVIVFPIGVWTLISRMRGSAHPAPVCVR